MGNNFIDLSCDDVYTVELNMNIHYNFSQQPHHIKIICRTTKKVFLEKKCNTENEAITYLEESKNFKNNKKKFIYCITGPNLFLYES